MERTAYVAGGCGLLGSVIVQALKQSGISTYRIDLNPMADFQIDLADQESFLRFFENRRLDVWVNASYPKDPIVHFRSFLETSKAIAQLMSDSGGGSIVLLSSIYGMVGGQRAMYRGTDIKPVTPDYCAVKAGIIGLTRALATEYAPYVSVNCVAPGGVYDGHPVNFQMAYNERVPLNRMATPEDVAEAVTFLAGANYITGQVLAVDGGFTAW